MIGQLHGLSQLILCRTDNESQALAITQRILIAQAEFYEPTYQQNKLHRPLDSPRKVSSLCAIKETTQTEGSFAALFLFL